MHNRRIRKKEWHNSTVKLKFIYDFLPSGKVNFDIPHQCKHCKEIENNTTLHNHFLQCYQSTAIKTNKLLLINNRLQIIHTPPSIITIIIQGLTSYYNGQDTKDTLKFNTKDLHIAQHQNAIGWYNFTRGRISKTLQRAIAYYYTVIRSINIPTSWTSIVVGNLIDIHLDAWKDWCQDIHGQHHGQHEYICLQLLLSTIAKDIFYHIRTKNGLVETSHHSVKWTKNQSVYG